MRKLAQGPPAGMSGDLHSLLTADSSLLLSFFLECPQLSLASSQILYFKGHHLWETLMALLTSVLPKPACL